jgi:methionine-rich copper-binding protein CopC
MALIRIILVLGALLAAPPALAHAFLAQASPSAGAELREPPAAVRITFTAGVEAHFSSIEVRNAAGARLDAANPHADGAAETLAVDLPKLPPGTYTVIWHATSVDTHKTEGKFTFAVLP